MSKKPGSGWARSLRAGLSLVLALGASSPAAAAQKVLIVMSKNLPPFERAAQSFKKCFAAKGFNPSFQDVVLPENLAEAELALKTAAAGKPDLILTLGAGATRLTRERLPHIPSVFCMVLDPGANGLDKGGVSMDPRPADYLDYIHRHFSQLKRVGVLYNPRQSKTIVQELKKGSANPEALVLQEVNDLSALDGALQGIKAKSDCLLMIPDASIYTPQTAGQIILQTIQMGLPFIALSAPFVKGGALAALYADWGDNGCQAADLAARVLQGEDAASLPLLPPRKLSSSVNLIVADRLKVTVSAAARSDAEELIQ
jgi:putative ABC transport system substrate-binding protein